MQKFIEFLELNKNDALFVLLACIIFSFIFKRSLNMLIKNEINKPLKIGATYEDAFERFLKVSNFNIDDITDYKPATKPYLTCLGLKNISYINNSMLIFLKNGEILLYNFSMEKEES